jgi:hypothetical protein
MTARTSSMRASSVGAPLTRSDIPTPRLSNRISRENVPSFASVSSKPGSVHWSSTCVRNGETKTTSNGPSPLTW